MADDDDKVAGLVDEVIEAVEAAAPRSPRWVRLDALRDGQWYQGPVFADDSLGAIFEIAWFLAQDAVALRGVCVGDPTFPDDVLAYEWTRDKGWRDVWRTEFDTGVPYDRPVQFREALVVPMRRRDLQ